MMWLVAWGGGRRVIGGIFGGEGLGGRFDALFTYTVFEGGSVGNLE